MLKRIGSLGWITTFTAMLGCGAGAGEAGVEELGRMTAGQAAPHQEKVAPKVSICHYSAGEDHFHVITISDRAVAAHFANHGDTYPGTYYADDDGDGYGDAEGSTDPCPNEGFVVDTSDCDDTNAAISPASAEVVDDGLDNDCDPSTPDSETSWD